MCFKTIHLLMGVASQLPWVPEVFLTCGRNFRCRPKADAASAVGRRREKNAGHFQDLTETGNRALEKSMAPRVPLSRLSKIMRDIQQLKYV